MKKGIVAILVLLLMFGAYGCGSKDVSAPAEPPERLLEAKDSSVTAETEDVRTEEVKTEQNTNIAKRVDIGEVETKCREIVDALGFWEYEYLYMYEDDKLDGTIDFTTNGAERVRAAVLSSYPEGGVTPETTMTVIDIDIVQKNARDLFGMEVDMSLLPTGGDINVTQYNDNGTILPMRFFSDAEDEGVFYVFGDAIFEEGDGFTYSQQLYCGYWGYFNEKNPNYEVFFRFIPDDNSAYGYVLTEMTFAKYTNTGSSNEMNREAEPFYGIWCCGVKDEADALKVAQDLDEKGFDGRVIISSEWSNLNQDKWYVVTAGLYDTELQAQNDLANVQNAGYKDAYIKYTGYRK